MLPTKNVPVLTLLIFLRPYVDAYERIIRVLTEWFAGQYVPARGWKLFYNCAGCFVAFGSGDCFESLLV